MGDVAPGCVRHLLHKLPGRMLRPGPTHASTLCALARERESHHPSSSLLRATPKTAVRCPTPRASQRFQSIALTGWVVAVNLAKPQLVLPQRVLTERKQDGSGAREYGESGQAARAAGHGAH